MTHLGRDKVAGTLLDGNLASKRVGHLLAIPVQAPQIILIPVKEVHLAARLLDAGMQIEHLEQGPRAALAYANYQSL